MNELEQYRQFGSKIEELIRPASFPLAIKVINSGDDIPDRAKRPSKDLGGRNFVCQNFKVARSYGWTMAITEEDCNCKVARSIYGWDPVDEEMHKFAVEFTVGLYSQNAETSAKYFDTLYYMKHACTGLVISPLTRTKVVPDVVQVYGLPAQIMRFVQGYLYMQGGTMAFASSGRSGSCHEGIVKTMQLDQPQVVLLGNGDRVWGGADDSEIMLSIPKSKLPLVVKGLEETHKAGLRYPIPKYMNYSPGFQADFAEKAVERAGGTLVKENPGIR